jgi:hypothetical protein
LQIKKVKIDKAVKSMKESIEIGMNNILKIPPVVEDFIKAKIYTRVPLLPCVYGDFESMQIGYRWDPVQQRTLITDDIGSWQENWYVIAQNELGDPFFTDFTTENYPVYTAIHGRGVWKPLKVSDNICQFAEVLNKINSTNLNFPCSLDFLNDIVDLKSDFWCEVNESCKEVE